MRRIIKRLPTLNKKSFFSQYETLTKSDIKRMIRKGVTQDDYQFFTTEKYSRTSDTKNMIEQLYFGDIEQKTEKELLAELAESKTPNSAGSKIY